MKTPKNPNPSASDRNSNPSGQSSAANSASAASNLSRSSSDEIARRAHDRWQRAGGNHGDDQAHWFAAEQELAGDNDAAGKMRATRRDEP